jgi:hypothetical protein
MCQAFPLGSQRSSFLDSFHTLDEPLPSSPRAALIEAVLM